MTYYHSKDHTSSTMIRLFKWIHYGPPCNCRSRLQSVYCITVEAQAWFSKLPLIITVHIVPHSYQHGPQFKFLVWLD